MNRPEVIVGVEGQVRTGHTSSALSGSVSLLKSLNPAVLFASLSHKYTDSRDFADIALLEPERTTTLTLGYAFALNDALSVNTSVFTEYRDRTRFTRAILRENDFSALQLGLTANVAPGVYLQPTVSLGLNGTGSVFSVGMNIPMTFGAD